MAIYQSWDDIYSISNMRITTVSGEGVARNIFSNGFNNVQVIIQFIAVNQEGNVITGIPATDIQSNTGLITNETGTNLIRSNYTNQTGWFYNINSDAFTIEPPASVLQKAQETAEANPYDDRYPDRFTPSSLNYNSANYVEVDQPPYYADVDKNAARFDYSAPINQLQQNEGLSNDDWDQSDLQSSPSVSEGISYEAYRQDDHGNGYYSPSNEYGEPSVCAPNEPVPLDDWSQAAFYVRHGTNEYSVMQIAAFINLTHPFAPRNYYSTNRNSASGFYSYVTIVGHEAIDYSDSRNVVIPPASSVVNRVQSNDLLWEKRNKNSGYHQYYNAGIAEYAFIDFTPKIGGYFSQAVAYYRHYLTNLILTVADVYWYGLYEHAFSAFGSRGVYPLALLTTGGVFQAFYLINPALNSTTTISIDGPVFFESSAWLYRFSPYFYLEHVRDATSNPAMLVRVRLTMFENAERYYWHYNDGSPITLFLQDKYGNFGNFQFIFDNDRYFDMPVAL